MVSHGVSHDIVFVTSHGFVHNHGLVLYQVFYHRIGNMELVSGHTWMLMSEFLALVASVALEVWVAAFGMHVVVARPFVFTFGMKLTVIEPVAAPLTPLPSLSSSFVAGVRLIIATRNYFVQ